METNTDRMVVLMPLTDFAPGASGGWKASGALAPLARPMHEGTGLPSVRGFAGRREPRGSASEMRINVPDSDLPIINVVTTNFTNDVPGTRSWSPPA